MKNPILRILIPIYAAFLSPLLWAQGQTMVFSAMGDVPYSSSEYPTLQQQMADHNLYSPSAFLVHVGDIKSGSTSCSESHYEDVAAVLKEAAVPVYIIPGDNEWNDCSNPNQAWQYWTAHFTNFEENFCSDIFTERQSVRPENFAFVLDGVLFIGINLVGGRVHSQSEWNTRMQQDADWVSSQFQAKKSQVRAAAVFAHAGPDNSNRDLFFDQFEPAAATFAKPILFLHGDGHSWKLDKPFPQQNVTRVQVKQGGSEDPLEVTVNMSSSNPWVFKRNPWSGNPPVFNVKPCVQAGEDINVSFPNSANLQGKVTDDGVPLNPGSVTVTWSKTSGPGNVTFGNPNSVNTSASFSVPGTYVLRLTASDGALQNYDELTVISTGTARFLSINDVQLTEGNSGTKNAVFTVTLSGGGGPTVTVDYATADSTALAGSDYQAKTGSLSFSGSTTTRTISVVINGDTNYEPDEFFLVNLSNPVNAGITKAKGIGTIQNDDALPPPVISSFTPPSGPQGTEVTVTGQNFISVSNVTFNGVSAASYTVDSNTQIRAEVPSGALTGPVRVIAAAGTGISATNFVVTFVPLVASFTPTGGIIGAEVTISGANFTGATAVAFNGILASVFFVDSGTQVRAQVPAGASSGKISVTNNDGTGVSEDDFTVILPPAITGFTPLEGPPGTEVTISGSGFAFATDVSFNGVSAAVINIDSDSQLRAEVPEGATTGKISVTNPAGSDASAEDFQVTAPPSIIILNPTDDAWVRSSEPTENFGSSSTIRLKQSSSTYNGYLKFTIPGLGGPLYRATLRLLVIEGSDDGGKVYSASNNYIGTTTPWVEDSVIWDNAPEFIGLPMDSVGEVVVDDTVEFDVTSAITSNGVYTFALSNNSETVVRYSSKEGDWIPELIIETIPTGLPTTVVNARVFLEGPYKGSAMNTALSDGQGLPLQQPYDTSPWNYSGEESLAGLPAGMVDWILIGLRTSPAAPDTAQRVALLQSDGTIVDTSGAGPVQFTGLDYGDYYIVIYHRNHLPAMSSSARSLDNSSALYNFTASQAQAYGTNPMKEIAPGVFGLIAGDGNSDGIINEADRDAVWRPQDGTAWLYGKYGDFDLDGGIDAADLNRLWRANNGLASQVPGMMAIAARPGKPGHGETKPAAPASNSKPKANHSARESKKAVSGAQE